jgi:MFS family permease
MPATAPAPAAAPSAWAPLANPVFRALWLATVASNIGNWMHEVGAGWMMTTLTSNPLLVALVQTAITLPFFFFALPAGVLTDLLDRRRYLIAVQIGCLVTGAALALLAWLDVLGPVSLLVFTFLLGVGNAATAPAWQAIVPELVPKQDLPGAVALNGVGMNIARAIGPAVGGFLVALAGPWLVFALNFVSFIFIVVALVRWRRVAPATHMPPESFGPAVLAGLRYARHSPGFLKVVARVAAFMAGASAVWALLPVVARGGLGVSATGYGLLLGALGAGAVTFASQLARVRRRFTPPALVSAGAAVFLVATLAMAFAPSPWLLGAALYLAGGAWLAIVSSFNVGAQAVLPGWVRGRALSIYLLVFFGGLALGSAVWGAVAGWIGAGGALLAAAGFQVLAWLLTRRLPLSDGRGVDLGPSHHWPAAPAAYAAPGAASGQVLVRKTFRVAPEQQEEFLRRAAAVGRIRRRDGALLWSVFRDERDPELLHETFVHADELEHVRSHERFTVEDRAAEEALLALHRDANSPQVRHYRQARTEPAP